MEGHSVHLAFRIQQLKGRGALLRKRQLLQRNQDDPVLRPVVVTQLEVPFGKLGVVRESESFGWRFARPRLALNLDLWFLNPGAVAFRTFGRLG